jgi:hypothetical protein
MSTAEETLLSAVEKRSQPIEGKPTLPEPTVSPSEDTPTAEKTLSPEEQEALDELIEQSKKPSPPRAPGGQGLDGIVTRVKSKKAAENLPAPTPPQESGCGAPRHASPEERQRLIHLREDVE